MAESKEYMTLPEENGSINISEEVIAAIAVGAVREVEGVSGMMTSMGGVMDLVDKKNDGGIRPSHPRGGGKRPEGGLLRCGGHDRLPCGGGQHPCGRRDPGINEREKDELLLWYGIPHGRLPSIFPMN